eukprot:COSAG01_NODE_19584_length_1002_cov_0.910299_2_plen_71_part_00
MIHARDGSGGTPNTDGIEPMWTKDVHIHDVTINNGDVRLPTVTTPLLPRLTSFALTLECTALLPTAHRTV